MKNENTGENLSEEMRKQKEIEELLHELMKKDIETDHRIATERKIAELAEDLKDIEHKNSVKRTLEDLKLKEEKYKLKQKYSQASQQTECKIKDKTDDFSSPEKKQNEYLVSSDCPFLDVEYNKNLFLMRNTTSVLKLRFTIKSDELENLSLFMVKERNGSKTRREIPVLSTIRKGKRIELLVQLSPGDIFGTLGITFYVGCKTTHKICYYSFAVSAPVYDSKQSATNLSISISNTINAEGAADVSVSNALDDLKKNNASVNEMIQRLNSLPADFRLLSLDETNWRPEDYMIDGNRFKGNKIKLKINDMSIFLLGKEKIKLGRSQQYADLIVKIPTNSPESGNPANRTVSRHHATFEIQGDSVFMEDVSSYGTFLNGKKYHKQKCKLKIEDTSVNFGEINWMLKPQLCQPASKTRYVCQSCNCKENDICALAFTRCDKIKEAYLVVNQCCDLGQILPKLQKWTVFFRNDSFFLRDPLFDFHYVSPNEVIEADGIKISVCSC